MSIYFIGILLALLVPVLHAWANIIDSDFSNKIFKRLASIIFFSELVGLVFLPIIIIISPPTFISLKIASVLFICAAIEIFYLFPYYWSFREADTSIVTSLFSFDKIFVPVLAFFLVGERLSVIQYAGLFIIVLSTVLLTFNSRKHKINRALYFMFFVSLILAIESVLYKFVFDQGVSWGTAIIWTSAMQFAIASLIMLFPKNRADFSEARRKMNKVGYLLVLEEALSWFGENASVIAISLIPVSVVEGIGGVQPLIVLAYAMLFEKRYPCFFKEYIGKDGILKKVLFFGLILFGTIMLIYKF